MNAPIGGVVTELGAREGMTVMAGATLFRINGLDTVWVNAELRRASAAQVRPGNPVEARTSALPGTTFKGRVNAILPEVNAATRTLKARVEFANPNGRLVPGMFATVNFAPAARKEVLLVPTEAVIQTGKSQRRHRRAGRWEVCPGRCGNRHGKRTAGPRFAMGSKPVRKSSCPASS